MSREVSNSELKRFTEYLSVERGLAPLSIVAYATDIRQFAEFLGKHGSALLTARNNDVREFVRQLFSHQADGRSVARKLSALRHLYRFLLLDKKIDHDPTLNIQSPKQWKVLPIRRGSEVVAALSVTGPAGEFTPPLRERLLPPVREAALALEEANQFH